MKLTYICHVVDTVTGPFAPDNPDCQPWHTEEHSDSNTEANDQTEVSDHNTDTVCSQVTRSAHAATTVFTQHVSASAEVTTICWHWFTAGAPPLMGTIGTTGRPGAPNCPTSINWNKIFSFEICSAFTTWWITDTFMKYPEFCKGISYFSSFEHSSCSWAQPTYTKVVAVLGLLNISNALAPHARCYWIIAESLSSLHSRATAWGTVRPRRPAGPATINYKAIQIKRYCKPQTTTLTRQLCQGRRQVLKFVEVNYSQASCFWQTTQTAYQGFQVWQEDWLFCWPCSLPHSCSWPHLASELG